MAFTLSPRLKWKWDDCLDLPFYWNPQRMKLASETSTSGGAFKELLFKRPEMHFIRLVHNLSLNLHDV